MTTTNQPASSSALGFLQALQSSNQWVALGVAALGVIVPGVKALITSIKQDASGTITITFSDLVAADQAELQKVIDASNTDLAAINAELVRLGAAPLPMLAPAAPVAQSATAVKSHVTVNGKPL